MILFSVVYGFEEEGIEGQVRTYICATTPFRAMEKLQATVADPATIRDVRIEWLVPLSAIEGLKYESKISEPVYDLPD